MLGKLQYFGWFWKVMLALENAWKQMHWYFFQCRDHHNHQTKIIPVLCFLTFMPEIRGESIELFSSIPTRNVALRDDGQALNGWEMA